MSERHMDQFLGAEIGPVARDEVLTALREHSYEVVIELENADGSVLLHAAGWLQIHPDNPEHFVIHPHGLRPGERPRMYFGVPESGIVQYSEGGYRFMLPGGTALVVLPWHGVLHVTPSGDVAPGLGGFNMSIEERGDDS